jgi:hypothetical protein
VYGCGVGVGVERGRVCGYGVCVGVCVCGGG